MQFNSDVDPPRDATHYEVIIDGVRAAAGASAQYVKPRVTDKLLETIIGLVDPGSSEAGMP